MGRETNLNHIADAAIACALNDDKDGYKLLVKDLDPEHLQGLGWKLAYAARDAMVAWARDGGISEEQAREIWRIALLQRQQQPGACRSGRSGRPVSRARPASRRPRSRRR